jgi:hypothetical protein
MRVNAAFDHAKALLQVELPEGFSKFEERVSPPNGINEEVEPALFLPDLREQRLDGPRIRVVDHNGDPNPSSRGHALGGLFNRFQAAAQFKT